MRDIRRQLLPLLVGATFVLTGCGDGAIDAGVAGDFQSEVRAIATAAAAGDADGAVVLAGRLKEAVAGARSEGSVTENRAALISMRIDAVIASLDDGQEPSGTEGPSEAPAEAPAGEPTQPAPVDPAPAQPAPADAPPAQPAPVDAPPAQPAPVPVPDGSDDAEEADDGEGNDGEEADDGAGNDGGEAADGSGGAGEEVTDQQRKAEERARRAAEKAVDGPGSHGRERDDKE